jgi:hypothetical protein
VASINYRLSQHAAFPAQIEDCKVAVRWLRANAKTYNLNSERIGVWGASAGGHLVALLGTSGGIADLEGKGGNAGQSRRVQAVVNFFGPTDFLQMDAHAVPGARMKHDPPTSPESCLIGGARIVPSTRPSLYSARQSEAYRASRSIGLHSSLFVSLSSQQDHEPPRNRGSHPSCRLW